MNKKLDQLLEEREEIAKEIKLLQKKRMALSSHISVIRYRERKESVR